MAGKRRIMIEFPISQEDSPHPNSHSTYLVDPPLPRSLTLDQVHAGIYTLSSPTPGVFLQPSPYIHQHIPPSHSVDGGLTYGELQHAAAAAAAAAANPNMVGPDVCDNGAIYSVVNKNRPQPALAAPTPVQEERDFEDTESEYAVELRKQAYLQGMGKLKYLA